MPCRHGPRLRVRLSSLSGSELGGSEPSHVHRMVQSHLLNHVIEISWPVGTKDGDEIVAKVSSLLPSFHLVSTRLGDLVGLITSSKAPPLFTPPRTPTQGAEMDVDKGEEASVGELASTSHCFQAVSIPQTGDNVSFAITPDGFFHLRMVGREGYESLGLVGSKSTSAMLRGTVNSQYNIRVKLNSRTFKEGRGHYQKVIERLNTLSIKSMWISHDPNAEGSLNSELEIGQEWTAKRLNNERTSHTIKPGPRIPLPSCIALQEAAKSLIGSRGQQPDSADLFHTLHDWLGGISCALSPASLDSILALSPGLLNGDGITINEDVMEYEDSKSFDGNEAACSAIRTERWTGLIPSHRILAIIKELQEWMVTKGAEQRSSSPPWISFASWGVEGSPVGLPGERDPGQGNQTHYRILLLPGGIACTFETYT